MTFLNPSILLGLFAASIPIIIHFLNLRKIKTIEFSSLQFLIEIQKTKIKKLKFKQWLLLFLRTLIILLIVSAFARPTLESVSLGNISPAAKSSIVIILDNSMSMGYLNESGNYFNRCKKMIKKLINEVKAGDDISLITTTGKIAKIKNETRKQIFIKKLSSIELNDSKGNISNALILANNLLAKSNNYIKEIYLLTDFQKSNISKTEIKNVFSSEKWNNAIKIYLFKSGSSHISNAAITSLKSDTKIFVKNKTLKFEGIAVNYSGQRLENDAISLFVNEKRTSQKSVNLLAGQSKSMLFNCRIPESGLINFRIQLEEDNLDSDNSRYLCINIPDKIGVIIYTNNKVYSKYIRAALVNENENNFKVEIKNPRQFTPGGDNNVVKIFIGSSGLKSNIFGKQNKIPASTIIFPSPDESLEEYKVFANIITRKNLEGIINLNNNFTKFNNIDLNHPVFQNLFSNKEEAKIISPGIRKFLKIRAEGNIKPVIKLYDGSIFCGEISTNRSKAFVFAVPPTLDWSNFPIKGIFAPLIQSTIYYLSAQNQLDKSYLAGNSIHVNLRELRVNNIKVVRPNGIEEFIAVPNKSKKFYNYTNTNLAGNYAFYSGNKLIDYASINIDPTESQTDYWPVESIISMSEEAGNKGEMVSISGSVNIAKLIHSARYGSELWRIFLIMAFLIALLEMYVSRSSKKDFAELEK